MKKYLILLSILFSVVIQAQTVQFTQRTDDYARPMGGAEWWYGQNVYPINYSPIGGYWRYLWNEIEPIQSQYNWTFFDQQLNVMRAKGSKFNFAIMCQDDYYGGLPIVDGGKCTYPAGLHFQMQSEPVKDIKWSNGVWWQNFNSPSYIKDWTNMYAALAKHCIDNGLMKYIGYVEMACVGNSGEWTSSDATVGSARHPTTATLKALCSAIMNSFPDKPCVVLCSAFDGNYQLANTRIPADFGEWILTVKNNWGLVGWTKKSWGDKSPWNVRWTYGNTTVMPDGFRFDTAINNRGLYAPVTGEPSNFPNAANPGPFDDVDNEITQSKVASIGNGNYEGSEIGSAVGIKNMTAAFKKMGNRISVTGATLTGNKLSINWVNTGSTPVYEDWDATLELRNSSGVQAQKSGIKLKLFMGPTTYSDVLTGSGTGDLYLIVRDPTGVMQPYPLGLIGRQSDGSYLILKNVSIGGGIPVPPDSPVAPIYCDTIIKVTHDTVIKVTHDSLIHRVCPGPPPTSYLSIYTTQFPAINPDNDGNGAAEMGLKFRSTIPTKIYGVRFYKKQGMNGTHIGELYTTSGARLAQGTFTSESATGWQTVLFSSPVLINANTTYVAAVWYSDGNKLEQNNFFQSGITNQTLTALANGVDGENAPQNTKSPQPAFPAGYWKMGGYWIDVISAK